ncbi:MAG: CBS domain-containing protein [Planctomycetes bacterium]|nr:CBS domain-containing protein [Planctomycetota bacterium]
MVQFTEILPKTLGVRFNHALAVFAARPLYAAVGILSPLLKIIHWVNRPLQIKPHRLGAGEPTATEEISALAGLARLSKQISDRQERIIKGASRLSGLATGQVMIPIEHVSFLSTAQTISEALIFAHIDAHTRFPVCENGDRNRVVGFVNFKEMIYFMRTNPNDSSLRGVIRPVLFVEPKTSIPVLLEMFVEQHVHMSIVRDEDGKTLGMVTMEDIVEELLGDIQDEFDHLPKTMHALSEGTWMIGGGTTMQDVVRQTGLDIQSSQETLAIWLGARLCRIPVPGDVHREAGAEFTVRRIRRGKAYDVSVAREIRIAEAGAGKAPAPPPGGKD